jgi:hypothetical protein
MSLLSNIVTSQFTKSERWLKLYRIIHHLFLKEEFIHTVDYNLMVTQMNARITELEVKLLTELTSRDLRFATHFHIAPQAPVGTLPTLPPTILYKNTLAPTKPVVPVTTAMQAADAALMATGPAQAPLADGISPDELRANSTIIADIGF